MRRFYRFILYFLLLLLICNPDTAIAQLKLENEPGNIKKTALTKLSTAIQIPTVSAVEDQHHHADGFLTLHKHLAEVFPLTHRTLQKEVINKYSLLYTWSGANAELDPILISAHMDVVPVEAATEDVWQQLPYSGTIKDGFVWGRGTMDDKYRVIAILEAVEQLLANGYQPERTIYLAFGHDEEVGGYNGAGKISALLQARAVKLEAVFDEGLAVAENVIPGVTEQLALVGTAAKGNLNLKLTVTGEGGHSSVPPIDTPIGILSSAIVRLQDNPFEPRMIPTTKETVALLAGRMGGKYKFAMRHYGLFRKKVLKMLAKDQATDALIRTKMAPTILEAGDKYNVLPRVATAVINIRILNGEDAVSVMEHVNKAIADERVQVEVYGKYTPPSPVTATDTWVYAALQSSITDVFPKALVVPALFPGATDSKHYTNLTSNIFRFAPQVVNRQSAKLVHNVNERISLEVFEQSIQFYEILIKNTCGAGAAQYFANSLKGELTPIGITGE